MPNNRPVPPTATLHAPTTLAGAHSPSATGPHHHLRMQEGRRRRPSCRRATRARLASCNRRALASGGPCQRARAAHSSSSSLARPPRPPQAPLIQGVAHNTICWQPHLPQEPLGSSSLPRPRTRRRLLRHRARGGTHTAKAILHQRRTEETGAAGSRKRYNSRCISRSKKDMGAQRAGTRMRAARIRLRCCSRQSTRSGSRPMRGGSRLWQRRWRASMFVRQSSLLAVAGILDDSRLVRSAL